MNGIEAEWVVPSSRASTEAMAPFSIGARLGVAPDERRVPGDAHPLTTLSAGSADFEAWCRANGVRMIESTRRTYSCGCCASGVQERLGPEWMVHVPLETAGSLQVLLDGLGAWATRYE